MLRPTGLTIAEIESRRSMYQQAARGKTRVEFTSPQGPRREALEVSLHPIWDEGGHCTHLLWNARVVTDRVRVEMELKEREERLRLVFNAHQDLQSVIRVEPDGRFVNEAFNQAQIDYAKRFIPDPNRFLERGREEFLRSLGLQESEIERSVAVWREVFTKKLPVRHELTYEPGAGRSREIGDVTVAPILNRNGVCTHLLWTAHFITKRRLAEEEVRKREQELAEAQSIGHIGSWTWDVFDDKVTWSDETFRIFGLEPQQFPPSFQAFLKSVHPDEREAVESIIWSAFKARMPHECEHRIVRPDGTERYVHTRSLIHLDSSGQPQRVLGTLHDITERKQTELRERQHLQRLKQLSELSMMLAGDPATVFERVVRMMGELFRPRAVRLSQIAGCNLQFSAVYADNNVTSNLGGCPLEIAPCATVKTHKTIRIYQRVQELFPQAAFLRDHDAYTYCGVPCLDNKGEVVAVICLLYDKPREFAEDDHQILWLISQRIATEVDRGKSLAIHAHMETTLREKEGRLKEAQRMARLGSWEADECAVGVEWSDEMYQILELDPLEVSPSIEVLINRIHPDDHCVGQELRKDQWVADPGRFSVEFRLLMPDGRIKDVLASGSIGRVADGKLLRRGTLQDITERKQAERERQKLQMQLVQAQKLESIGRLAGGIAHDFNNLLTVINGYSSRALIRLHDADQVYQALECIQQAGRTGANLVHQLLAFSRRQILSPEIVSLNNVVSSTEKILRRLVGDDVEMICNLTSDVDLVLADRTQIEQVIINLAVTARDAMPQGGTLTIETRRYTQTDVPELCQRMPPPPAYLELVFRDTGVGIDDHALDQLFEPFFTTKETGKGTGLGLSMVHGIVSQSGGWIRVESELSEGSAFHVWLPAAERMRDPNFEN